MVVTETVAPGKPDGIRAVIWATVGVEPVGKVPVRSTEAVGTVPGTVVGGGRTGAGRVRTPAVTAS